MAILAQDPLLCSSAATPQYTLFPIQNDAIFHAYKCAVACFWSVEEIDLSEDRASYDTLSSSEKHFINTVLAFFAASDALVNENLQINFASEVALQEAKLFYAFQSAIEGIHSETYSLLIDTLVSDEDKKTELFAAVTEMPAVKAKADWMQTYMDTSTNTFAERLVAFACVEGILFSASFAAVFFFKRSNKMPGLCFSNELISRDEGMHTEFAVLMHGQLQPQNQCSHERMTEIVRQAVATEECFVRESLSKPVLGMNSDSMIQYVQFVADRLLVSLGADKTFKRPNPFPWMMTQSLAGKTNFFERRVQDYTRAGVLVDPAEMLFRTDAAF
jgi:ribonucleoside-diphosphate reductase beta chain